MVQQIEGTVKPASTSTYLPFGPHTTVTISALNGLFGSSSPVVLGEKRHSDWRQLPTDFSLEINEEALKNDPDGHFHVCVKLESNDQQEFLSESIYPIKNKSYLQEKLSVSDLLKHFTDKPNRVDVELISILHPRKKLTGEIELKPFAPDGVTKGEPLDADSRLEVRVIDCSLAGARSVTLGETIMVNIKQSPIPYQVEYDDTRIREMPRGRFSIQAFIYNRQGDLIYCTDTSFSVIDKDHLDFFVVPVVKFND